MKIGMLWFDGSDAPLLVKLQKAVEYYTKKYGRRPEICEVHPTMFEKVKLENISVHPDRYILPKHILVGIEDKN